MGLKRVLDIDMASAASGASMRRRPLDPHWKSSRESDSLYNRSSERCPQSDVQDLQTEVGLEPWQRGRPPGRGGFLGRPGEEMGHLQTRGVVLSAVQIDTDDVPRLSRRHSSLRWREGRLSVAGGVRYNMACHRLIRPTPSPDSEVSRVIDCRVRSLIIWTAAQTRNGLWLATSMPSQTMNWYQTS